MTDPRADLCARLKAAREEKGVSLEEIAASTKIPAALFRGLERNDLSRWPKGLFRRSYLRDYLRLVGLPLDPIVREFVRVFPDSDGDPPAPDDPVPEAEDGQSPVLALAGDRSARLARLRTQAAAAALDAAVVLGASLALVLTQRTDPALSLAGIAVGYYSLATVCLGRGVGAHWLDRRRVTRWKHRGVRPRAARPLAERVRDRLAHGYGALWPAHWSTPRY